MSTNAYVDICGVDDVPLPNILRLCCLSNTRTMMALPMTIAAGMRNADQQALSLYQGVVEHLKASRRNLGKHRETLGDQPSIKKALSQDTITVTVRELGDILSVMGSIKSKMGPKRALMGLEALLENRITGLVAELASNSPLRQEAWLPPLKVLVASPNIQQIHFLGLTETGELRLRTGVMAQAA